MNDQIIIIVFVLTINSFYIYKLLNYGITKLFNRFDNTIKVESNIYEIK